MIDNVILLCSEITKGMKSYGPKAFIPIGSKNRNKPLIVKQIETVFDRYGEDTKIYVIIGFEYEKFVKILDTFYPNKSNIIQIYNKNYENTNSAYGMSLAINLIESGNTLVLQNGILTDYEPKVKTKSILPIIKNNTDDSFNIGLTINDKKVEYIFYDLPNKWSEILYINSSDINKTKQILSNNNIKEKFLFEIINILIENNIIFETEFISPKKIFKINNHKSKL